MVGATHIIEKVSVDINVASMDTAEKIKSEINEFVQNEVLSIVEAYLSDVSSEFEETIIQLDKVSLSIDASSWNIHSKKMKVEISNEVKKKLDPIVERAKEKALLLERKVVDNQEQFIDQEVQTYGKEERILKSLFHFLDHGTLSWWISSVKESRELFSEEVLKKAIRENLKLVARELGKRKGNQRFRERLMKQFSSSIVIEMIAIKLSSLSLVNLTHLKTTASLIQRMGVLPKEIDKKVLPLIWQLMDEDFESVFRKDASGLLFLYVHTHFFANSIVQTELNLALKTTHSIVSFLYWASGREENQLKLKSTLILSVNEHVSEDIWKRIQTTNTYEELISGMNRELKKFINTSSKVNLTSTKESDSPTNRTRLNNFSAEDKTTDLRKKDDDSADFKSRKDTSASDEVNKQADKRSSTNSEASEKNENDFWNKSKIDGKYKGEITDKLSQVLKNSAEDSSVTRDKTTVALPDALYVNNAGLVLLNAFLPAMFKQLNLLSDDGALIDPELAASILHYAATGREGDFEFEMTFEKYLCGISPADSIEREITLSEIQKEEVNKVLNSVLVHWSAMKNKPVALLQNEFLSRPGKLITDKSNHRLVIEKKSYDLLLDKLPWSYSMVKFSWKKELIFVEW